MHGRKNVWSSASIAHFRSMVLIMHRGYCRYSSRGTNNGRVAPLSVHNSWQCSLRHNGCCPVSCIAVFVRQLVYPGCDAGSLKQPRGR